MTRTLIGVLVLALGLLAHAPADAHSCTDAPIVVNATGGAVVYSFVGDGTLCVISLASPTSRSLYLRQGTGTLCGTNQIALLTGAQILGASSGASFLEAAGAPWLAGIEPQQDLCVAAQSGAQIIGVISYSDSGT